METYIGAFPDHISSSLEYSENCY